MRMICKECKAELPKGKSLKHRVCRIIGLCEYCYKMKISPESCHSEAVNREVEEQDYDEYNPWGWIDRFHEDMR